VNEKLEQFLGNALGDIGIMRMLEGYREIVVGSGECHEDGISV
jgi:hypothetical protein